MNEDDTKAGYSWKEMIAEAMEDHGETVDNIVHYIQEKYDYDPSYFKSFFTAWTEKRVYFPVCHDGREWVDSVPRNPCNEATQHVGA